MNEHMTNQPIELDWDATIVQDEFELPSLPDGDYRFQVVNIEKARHQPREGGKLPPCNKAILTIRIADPATGQTVDIRHSLFLYSTMVHRLSEFFAAIGQKQRGVELKMDWGRVVGARGLCKVKKKERRDGRAESEIDRFYPAYDLPAGAAMQPAPQPYSPPQQPWTPAPQPGNGWNGGGF